MLSITDSWRKVSMICVFLLIKTKKFLDSIQMKKIILSYYWIGFKNKCFIYFTIKVQFTTFFTPQLRLYYIRDTRIQFAEARSGISMEGTQVTGKFGYSMAAGDLDDDGVDDLIVGEPYAAFSRRSDMSYNAINTGAVHIIYGPLKQVLLISLNVNY